MQRKQPTRTALHARLANRDARLDWNGLEADADSENWALLTVAQQRELCWRAHEGELTRHAGHLSAGIEAEKDVR